jgi:photosystem II stability/assembly factor-like uncharacterized protein
MVFRWVGIIGVLVFAFYLFSSSLADPNHAAAGSPPREGINLLATPSPTPTTGPPKFKLHFPNMIRHFEGPRVSLQAAWLADQDGNPSEIFLLNENAQYHAQILNTSNKSLKVGMRWIQAGPCGEFIVFDGSITLAPGTHQRMVDGIVPDCPGLYSVTVELTDLKNTVTESLLMVANPLSRVAIETNQGFDKCAVPTINQMQTWWIHSPYYAVNMYIGGISRACDQVNLTPSWLNAISQQGWTLIPTWVGPQAPCTDFRHRMSSNAAIAYLEGKDEADMAVSAALDLGIWGDMVIYYDLEGYFGNTSCRNTVASFVKGWVERLHQLGYQAGVYGGACSSSIADWAEISPAPDNVWIASWITPAKYRPDATVWLTGAAEDCLPNTLWVNHQRIRQYAGGHVETYGDISFSIDSNALDGEVTVLPTPTPAPTALAIGGDASAPHLPEISQAKLRTMQLINARSGWALVAENLLWTGDGGASWQDITPQTALPVHLLNVTFTSPLNGWLVRLLGGEVSQTSLEVLATLDGGQTWQPYPLSIPEASLSAPIAAAYLNFLDERTGFLSVKLESSSAFSLGRLFVTQDGGRTWEERSLPLGEPVVFLDAQRGWVAGGPGGDQLFRTQDGGRTWQPQPLPLPFSSTEAQVFVGLPIFRSNRDGSLPVTVTGLDPRFLVYSTWDGGESWSVSSQAELAEQPGMALPFSADSSGAWWAATPGEIRLSASAGQGASAIQILATGLPPGVIDLDFQDDQAGWALAQTSVCHGDKAPLGAVQAQPLRCATQTFLLSTADGGQTWQDITP